MKKSSQVSSSAPDLVQLLAGIGGPRGAPLTPAAMIENLQHQGYRIVKDDPAAERRRAETVKSFSQARWDGGTIVRFGVVSCTHLGSRHQQLTFLEAFYDRIAAERISVVLHAGDVTDGDGYVYRGHQYDLFQIGADRQRGYTVDRYPQRPGITTHMIAGNHDWAFWKRGGVDILESVAAARSDLVYHGPMGAKVLVDGVHIYLAHADGGVAYARSYKAQKRIEQFSPQEKPEIFLVGHYHVWDHLPMYRNVVAWTLGCFQSQTDYLKAKGLYPEIGGLILTIYRGAKGADRPGGFVRVTNEVVPFYSPKLDDY